MKNTKSCVLAGALLTIAVSAGAADRLLPGEWEMTLKMSMKDGPKIPPKQLEQMKKMGIKLPFGDGEPFVAKQCITPEQATADKPFNNDRGGNDGCSLQNYKHTGNRATGDMVCKGGDIDGGGPFEMTLDSEAAYHGGWTVKGVSRRSGPVEQVAQVSGRWLKANCDGASR